jgi:hypothetical protein
VIAWQAALLAGALVGVLGYLVGFERGRLQVLRAIFIED